MYAHGADRVGHQVSPTLMVALIAIADRYL
jgi:hypothetical protein